MRMSELAEVTIASLSRLSHLIKRLERRDLVRREPDPDDGRYTNAILTPAGLRLLTASAPAHVAKVRELVIDALSPAELRDAAHGVRTNPPTNRNQRPIARDRRSNRSATDQPPTRVKMPWSLMTTSAFERHAPHVAEARALSRSHEKRNGMAVQPAQPPM